MPSSSWLLTCLALGWCIEASWSACEHMGLSRRDQGFLWRHPRGVVLSGSGFSLVQVAEPEWRPVVTAPVSFFDSSMPRRRVPSCFWKEEAESALGRWDRACIWESGPAACVLLQRDIIGRCHLSPYILRENYPLGLAE